MTPAATRLGVVARRTTTSFIRAEFEIGILAAGVQVLCDAIKSSACWSEVKSGSDVKLPCEIYEEE